MRPRIEEAQFADLAALGPDWDGPVVRQSDGWELYEGAIARLVDEGLVYPCYCTRAEMQAAVSAPHGIAASDRYPGTCGELSATARSQKEASGRSPALRVRAGGARVSFEDRLLGRREDEVDDFVVRRNDGIPAYQLAVVVDDADGGVGEVVRGADLLDSTPRQVFLHNLLGFPVPRCAHVPLVLGPDRRRLAKRLAAVTLADRRRAGETPEEVLARMAASLGLSEPGDNPCLADLLSGFDPARLPREPTVWTPTPDA